MARRAATLARLTGEPFDVLVIGGGITGAGVARDAALRGLRVALLEREDFASGTSSRSSRLVHGGVRYLEHGHLRLVFESSRERRTLLRIAPHLVRPLAFTWPVYRGARISRLKLGAGLTLYDSLALFENVGRHRSLSAAKVLRSEPALREEGLVGGAQYWDASTDDARLTLANALGAADAGAAVLNHAPVGGFVREGGRIVGVTATDTVTGATFTARARAIVNATGPWSDEVRALEATSLVPSVRGAKGSHIAVPRNRLRVRDALTLLHPTDGRVFFAVPAGGQTIITTTEVPTGSPPASVHASRAEVRYLLDAANHYFPAATLGERDVISAWAGIRPLAAAFAKVETVAASREHTLGEGPGGVLHISGGKLTTYRAMAEQVVDRVAARLGAQGVRACATATMPLPGGDAPFDHGRHALAGGIADAGVRDRLACAYGSRAAEVWRLAERDARLGERVADGLPYARAEFVWGAACEMAMSLGDLLIRRTRVAFQCADHGVSLAPGVAALVAPLLGWDAERVRRELAAYEHEAEAMFAVGDEA